MFTVVGLSAKMALKSGFKIIVAIAGTIALADDLYTRLTGVSPLQELGLSYRYEQS